MKFAMLWLGLAIGVLLGSVGHLYDIINACELHGKYDGIFSTIESCNVKTKETK